MEGSAWQLLDGSTAELLGGVQLEQSSVAPGNLNRGDLGLACLPECSAGSEVGQKPRRCGSGPWSVSGPSTSKNPRILGKVPHGDVEGAACPSGQRVEHNVTCMLCAQESHGHVSCQRL